MSTEITKIDEGAAMLNLVEKAMTNPEVDVSKMQAILAMQEQVYDKNAQIEFNRAMSEMQNEIPCIEKNGAITVNGQVRSKYAKFEDIMYVVKPIMSAHGFSILFKIDTAECVSITGVLMHKSGHQVETTMRLPIDSSGSKNSVQALGSSVQYGKRYVLCALTNISTSDDDDGVVAGGAPEKIISEKAKAQVVDYMVRYMACLRENIDSVLAVRGCTEEGGDITINDAAALWYDMPEEDQMMIYGLATKKGGFLTTQERALLKSEEFLSAHRENIGANNGK